MSPTASSPRKDPCSCAVLNRMHDGKPLPRDPYCLGLTEKPLTDAFLPLEDPIDRAEVARCNLTISKPQSIPFWERENNKRASTPCSPLVGNPGAVPSAPSHRKSDAKSFPP